MPSHALAPHLKEREDSEAPEHEPEVSDGSSEHEADAKSGKLGREPEVRENRDCETVVIRECCWLHGTLTAERPLEPPRRERADEVVLRSKHEAICRFERVLDAPARSRWRPVLVPASFAVERRCIEVRRKDERERDESDEREPRPSRERADRGADGRVHDEIGLGVEVPTGKRHASRDACETTVGVVQQSLHLQQERGQNELATHQDDGRENPHCRVGENDGRGRDPRSKEEPGKETRQRAKYELEDEFSSDTSLVLACERRGGRTLCGNGHPLRSIVDTGAVAIADWSEVDGALERTFQFDSFVAALDFVNRVGGLAERENHHPDITINYNRVTLRWWTHTAGGITDRDRDLAGRTDELAA